MREIREAAADSSVKALVLRINSPGGSVTAAEEVGRELKRFKETTDKPIITSMGDSAASALIGCCLQRYHLGQSVYFDSSDRGLYALYEYAGTFQKNRYLYY